MLSVTNLLMEHGGHVEESSGRLNGVGAEFVGGIINIIGKVSQRVVKITLGRVQHSQITVEL